VTIDLSDEPPADLASVVHAELGVWPRIISHRRGIVDDVGAYLILGGGIFATALVQKTGEQTVTALGRVIGQLRHKRSAQVVNVTVADPTNTTFVCALPEGLSDAAVNAMRELDRSSLPRGAVLRWDAAAGRWQPAPPAR
jgi:hypothetical protein